MNHEPYALEPAFEENNIPVVLISSNLYAPYAGVLIQSLIEHTSMNNNYDIIIFERRISVENKRLLMSLGNGQTNISIRFCDPSFVLEEFPPEAEGTDRYPLEVYFNLLAPFALKHYQKIIVMDSDMLLYTDIAQLLNTDLEGKCVAAVQDTVWQGHYVSGYYHPILKIDTRRYFQSELGTKNYLDYVNTGMLLFDCEKWRQAYLPKTLLETAQKKNFSMADQDLLNYLMKGEIKKLPLPWNVVVATNRHIRRGIETAPDKSRAEYMQALEHPFVLHWAGRPKPWICPDVPYGSDWWAVALRTPFVGHILSRMIDGLEVRRSYYMEQHGEAVPVWEPIPPLKHTDKS